MLIKIQPKPKQLEKKSQDQLSGSRTSDKYESVMSVCTANENLILTHLENGRSNQDISCDLGISEAEFVKFATSEDRPTSFSEYFPVD